MPAPTHIPSVLVVDDDPTFCLMLYRFLEKKGLRSKGVFSAEEALAELGKDKYDVVLSDYRLPDKDGLELMDEIKDNHGYIPVVIMTSYADIRIAVKAMKLGAFDYVTKPVNPDEILLTVRKAVEKENGKQEAGETIATEAPVNRPPAPAVKDSFVMGQSPASEKLLEHVSLVAPTPISVLIIGESGSGKEYVARRIHQLSERKNKPFVSIDCGALSKELAASEMFGHLKGSFTGAIQDKVGQFEAANGGTLFLDEIGNLSYEIQVQLLRALQERRIRRIGSNKDIEVDVRIIAATNEDLQEAVKKGRFREDLYHRLNEFSIKVPSLRDRGDDILMFSRYFLDLANSELNRSVKSMDDRVTKAFVRYSWPGNLREMRNVTRRAVLLSKEDIVKIESLPPELVNEPSRSDDQSANDLKSMAEKTERAVIIDMLQQVNYNKSKAAKLLNIDRKTLYNKMKQFNIE